MSNVFIGRYKVIEEIGRGGMGIVYKAEDPALERLVAIKVLPPKKLSHEKSIKRFLREARLCAKLDHPNIIKIHDVGEQEGIYHIVMEYVDGRSLRDIIEERTTVSEIDINYMLEIFYDICEAFAYAHEKKTIHRDIKPDNIMLTREGRVKVMDFGLAAIEDRHSLTEMGQVMGTVAYFSPEQARGEPGDHRSDIYSLGALLFEMLTNRLVFEASTPGEMISKHLASPPVDPRTYNRKIPGVITDIILRSLNKDPDYRIQNVLSMMDILGDWLDSEIPKISSALSIKENDSSKVEMEYEEPFKNSNYSPDIPESVSQLKESSKRDDFHLPENLSYKDTPSGNGFAIPNQRTLKIPQDKENQKNIRTKKVKQDILNFKPEPLQNEYLDKTEEMVKIPPPPKVSKKPPLMENTPQKLASTRWRVEADKERKIEETDYLKEVDETRMSTTSISNTTLCPRCEAENLITRKYCKECGANLLGDNFISQNQAFEYIEKGRELQSLGQLEEAIIFFKKAIEMNPSLYEGYINLGSTLGMQIKYKEARLEYREAAKISPENPEPHILSAELYLMENRLDDAIYEYQQVEKISPRNLGNLFHLALLHSQRGDNSKAIGYYRKILSIDSKNSEARKQLGYLYISQNRIQDAIKELETVIRITPRDEQVCRLLSNLYLKVGNLHNAEVTCRSVLLAYPDDPEMMTTLGEVYEKQNRTDLAYNHLIKAVKKDVTNVEARKKLANILVKKGREDLALYELEGALSYNPEDSEIHENLGNMYLKLNQHDKALDHYEKSVTLSPNSAENHHKLAKLYNKKDYSNLSIQEFKKAVNLEPYNPIYREDLSIACYSQQNYEEAITEMKKATTLDSTNIDYQKALGVMYEEANKLEEARQQFQKVIDKSPRDATAQGMLGRVYSKQNLPKLAIFQFQKALNLNPKSHLFHVYLGRELTKLGHLKEAAQIFHKSISLAPGGSAARENRILAKAYADLGRVYFEQGELQKALEVLKNAESRNPKDSNVLQYIGIIFSEMKKYNNAQEYLTKALKYNPKSPHILRELANVYTEMGNFAMALSCIKKSLINDAGNVLTYEVMSKLFIKMRRFSEADMALAEAVKTCPNDKDYIDWLRGNVAFKKEDWQQALNFYQKAYSQNPKEWFFSKDLAKAFEKVGNYTHSFNQYNLTLSLRVPQKEEKKIKKEIEYLRKKI